MINETASTQVDKTKQIPIPTIPFVASGNEPAHDLIDSILSEQEEQVIIFSLELCEFCWSVEALFNSMNVNCGFIHLDSVKFKDNYSGQKIRHALMERVSSSTIPQVFVGGEYLGGYTKTLKAYDDGRLMSLLNNKGIEYEIESQVNSGPIPPSWSHPRGHSTHTLLNF